MPVCIGGRVRSVTPGRQTPITPPRIASFRAPDVGSPMKRWLVGVTAVGAVSALTISLAPMTSAQTEDPVDDPTVVVDEPTSDIGLTNSSCSSARAIARAFPISTAGVEDGYVTIGGWTVNFDRDGWIADHPSNPAITQVFHSMAWAIPDNIADVPSVIDLFVEQAADSPDPGSSASNGSGWKESQITLRTRTLLCIYKAADEAGKARLNPILDDLIEGNLDVNRYYGPPRTKPHNHGVMADRELLNVYQVTGDTSVAQAAERRLISQITGGMYDSCGMIREQSNGYQYFHGGLWRTIANRMPTDVFRNTILAEVERMNNAAYAVTWPSGVTPRIGDGEKKTVSDLSLVSTGMKLTCPETGWYSNRATANGITQQSIVRFGPATTLHGHSDKGQVLWWVGSGSRGDAVLADRGLPGKNRDSRYEYAHGALGHAVLLWPGGSDGRSTYVTKTSRGVTTGQFVMQRSQGTWKRTTVQTRKAAVFVIKDVVSGASASKPATANMPLDPTWLPTSTSGVFKSRSGKTLTITCATAKGKAIKPALKKVFDYTDSLAGARAATTVTCTVPRGDQGITTRLQVK